ERVGLRPGFGGEFRIDRASAAVHAAYGIGQTVRRRVLQQVAAGPRVERAAQVAGPREGGEDDHARGAALSLQLAGQLEPGETRHLDVGDDDVGPRAESGSKRFRAGSLLADDLEV